MTPAPRGIFLLMAGIPLAILPALAGERFWWVWLIYLVLCLLLLGVDAILLRPTRAPRIEVEAPSLLYIGRPAEMSVDLVLPGSPSRSGVQLLLDTSALLEEVERAVATTDEDGGGCVHFTLQARRRGKARIDHLWLRWRGPLGLMARQWREKIELELPVVPDIVSVRQAALRFFGSRDFLAGQKLERYCGDGSEFDRLREFVPGLDHRTIDWKASARHCKLLSREFRAERNHQIVIAVDTGHLMCEPLRGIPRLDHAINAGLLLSYFCLRAGDRVGLMGFDSKVRLYRRPQGGVHSFSALHLASAELEYSTDETNFTLGLMELASQLNQRSLIVLLTDFVDSISARLMAENLERLSRRHLVLFASLRNPDVDAITGHQPGSVHDMARSVVAGDMRHERAVLLRRMARMGIQAIDALPEQISPELLNRYLDIKRREAIA